MTKNGMKKFLILTLLFGFGLTLSAQQRPRQIPVPDSVVLPHVPSCDSLYYPLWTDTLGSSSLGTVSFISDREWRIEGNGITQIWSDVVHATVCDKQRMFGSYINRLTGRSFYFSDCCANPDQPGSFFTWCAVARFADTLCPPPWRVPVAKDFCELDKILFKRKSCNTHVVTPEQVIAGYINTWGGTFGGATGSGGQIHFQNIKAYYWSLTVFEHSYAFHLNYDSYGNIQSQCVMNAKGLGISLRCIRDE
jgi:uncharacterized protein (TIGR02145 family)